MNFQIIYNRIDFYIYYCVENIWMTENFTFMLN